jgi:predicted transcriptional regulator
MVLMITGISLFIRNGRRRKVLVALCEGEKQTDEIMASAQFKDKSYIRKLLRGLQKLKYVEKFEDGNIVYYKITDTGRKFLEKQSIEEVL